MLRKNKTVCKYIHTIRKRKEIPHISIKQKMKSSIRCFFSDFPVLNCSPEDAFVEMLISIGSLIGRTGSTRVLEKYEMHKSDLQTIANEKHSLGTGYKMIGILLNKNTLRNDKKGLEEFREKLEVASLFRAMEMINKFTKGKFSTLT